MDNWGNDPDPAAIPEGTRFRLPASLNIDALGLPPMTAAMAKAVQKYGMVVRDRAGAVTFYGEDPAQYPTNEWPTLYGGLQPWQVTQAFPWDKLQVLKLPSS